MKRYKQINTLLGWMVFLIASTVYILTSEPTMSFWDCGEYISTAYKLEVGHPPGAPLFQLLGRFFSLFAFGDVTLVARMVNTMSAVSSGFTILFLFWSITMLAKKIILLKGEMTTGKMYSTMGAGLVGALAYAFSDSFWFSAVEGEVYAMSSFFTAMVFWCILKWEEHADEEHAYRWLILIAYLMGLSIGVHMLNLLAIPAITFVYYFKKYPGSDWKKILLVLVLSFIILAIVMYVIIPWIIILAGWFERFFVNVAGLPFNLGTAIYFLILTGGIVFGLHYTRKRMKPMINTILLSFTFILIGYSSFLLLVVRSNADTPIDENNPENAMYLLSYLNREQYGDWPIFKGQYYNAPIVDRKDGNPIYAKNVKSGKYEIIDRRERTIPVYDPRFITLFPRMWADMEPRFAKDYIKWGKVKGVPMEVQYGERSETRNRPTFQENLTFFWNYQVIHMYWRYLMWNFAGKQNDNQGSGNKIDGNWKSGIPFLDKMRLGPQDKPDSLKNRADNSFYLLPLLLGLIGIFFTLRKDYRSSLIIFLLYFMTGLAIVLYLNQYSPQPRERDYAFAGSFYAFAIWIGLGVLQLIEWLSKKLDVKVAAIISTVAALVLVPGVMAQQGWDDHDRSGRYSALAIAENYLNTCAPNAILFANGDNDTFPLWYAQEVEGIRTDVRVVNLSLLNTEWYIDQMKRKAYDSDPVPFSLTRDKYRLGNHDITYFIEDEGLKNTYVNIRTLFDIINADDSKLKMNTGSIGMIDFFPTQKFMIPVNPLEVAAKGYVPAGLDRRIDTIRWKIDRQGIEKNSLMVLDLLAHNDWKRPVYFVMATGPEAYIGLEPWFHLEGMAYRLLPVKARPAEGQTGEVNTAIMYDNLMNKFKFGNLKDPKVYLDENNIRMVMNLRNLYSRLAEALILEGKIDSARKVLDRCVEELPDARVKFDFFMVPVTEAYFRIGDTAKASAIALRITKYAREELAYYFSFPVRDLKPMDMQLQESLFTIQRLSVVLKDAGQEKMATEAEGILNQYYNKYVENVYEPR